MTDLNVAYGFPDEENIQPPKKSSKNDHIEDIEYSQHPTIPQQLQQQKLQQHQQLHQIQG